MFLFSIFTYLDRYVEISYKSPIFLLKNHPGWKLKKKTSQRRPEPYSPAPGGRFGKLDGNGRCGPDGSVYKLYTILWMKQTF